MTESHRELLRQLHDLEQRAASVRQRLSNDEPSALEHPVPLSPQTRCHLHELVINHLSEAMLVVGLDGVILDASRPARWMFNLRYRNFGRIRIETILGDLLDQFGDNWSDQLQKQGGLGCSGRIDIGSARIEADMLMVAASELDQPLHVVLIRDVTAERVAARDNEELIKRLEEKHEELEAFTYRISHDLKSPLVSIGGFSKLLQEDLEKLIKLLPLERTSTNENDSAIPSETLGSQTEATIPASHASASQHDATSQASSQQITQENCPPSPSILAQRVSELCDEMRDHAQEIRRATHKAHGLIDQLLDLSRVAQATLELAPQEVRAIVDASIRAHAPELREAGVRVVLGKSLGTAWGDFQLLGSVFDNLISNAIRFLRDVPEPTLTIKHRELLEGPMWFVEDNGPGIPPGDRERVFDPFVRMDRAHKGSGIGLAIVRRIVEMHGGRAWIETGSQELGMRVCFTLAPRP